MSAQRQQQPANSDAVAPHHPLFQRSIQTNYGPEFVAPLARSPFADLPQDELPRYSARNLPEMSTPATFWLGAGVVVMIVSLIGLGAILRAPIRTQGIAQVSARHNVDTSAQIQSAILIARD